MFTCLSHDIIAHEVTHALVHRLRPLSREPSNPDVYAFHEGFADIVAIFQHSDSNACCAMRFNAHTDLSNRTLLAELASQFGHATGGGQALRTPDMQTDPLQYSTLMSLTIADRCWWPQSSDFLSDVPATHGGSPAARFRRRRYVCPKATCIPHGPSRRDEASATAWAILTMCIRAFDYLPPVDVTFGDFHARS